MTGDKSCACFVGHFGQPTIRAHFCSLWRPLHSLYILKLIPTGGTFSGSCSFGSFAVQRLSLSRARSHLQSHSLQSHSARSASLSRKLCIRAFRVWPEELVEKSKPCPLDPSAEGCGSVRLPKKDEDWLLEAEAQDCSSQCVFL